MTGDTGSVIGTDLVEEMLVYAREKAAQAKLKNIEFRCVDGETLEFEPSTFDAATIRWGLMFMPDPGTCLKHVYHALKDGGRVVAACWASPERNPFISTLFAILSKYMELPKRPPDAPGIFAFADPNRLHAVLATAGFIEIQIEEMELDVIEVDSGAAYWAAMEDLAGPVRVLVDRLDKETRTAFVEDVIKTSSALQTGKTLCMRGTTWIASGSR